MRFEQREQHGAIVPDLKVSVSLLRLLLLSCCLAGDEISLLPSVKWALLAM